MLFASIKRWKATTWFLAPVVAGLLCSPGALSVTKAHAAEPVLTFNFPIKTPADARSWGLDSLGSMMSKTDAIGLPLILNPNFKVPLPGNLNSFVKNRKAALVLGKALFWDMQVGSDGIQACATCHFQAGADVRSKNQVATQGNQVRYERDGEIIGFFYAPKTGTDAFEEVASRRWMPNFQLAGEDFPLVITQNAFLEEAGIIKADTDEKNRNDVVGSMGVKPATFAGVTPGSPVDIYTGTLGTLRPTTGRNAPASVNAVFNLYQFWDGRADFKFNGRDPVGRHNLANPTYFVVVDGKLKKKSLNMQMASLASQSTGPPLSDVEMSFAGRKWHHIGKKLTRNGLMKPLAYQKVSASDSVLGSYRAPSGYGLNTTYAALVKAAFKDNLWSYGGGLPVIDIEGGKYTQMEANFSMIWGLAVMLYEAELVSNQSKFDKWMEEDPSALFGSKELDGLNVFVKEGKCIACHGGPEFTNATVRNTQNGKEQIEPIRKTNGDPAFYDNGFYNVGMTPSVDDIQRGDKDGNDPGIPWGNARQFLFEYNGIMDIPFEITGLPIRHLEARNPVDTNGDSIPDRQELWKVLVDPITGLKDDFLVCIDLNMDSACSMKDDIRIETLDQDGNCKAPTIRNTELNAPYFHNGGAATLQQVLDNYDIGGKFRKETLNKVDMLPDIERLNLASVTPESCKADPSSCEWDAEEALVAFMVALTDHRVKTEKSPFDHPQLFVPIDGTAPMLDVTNPAATFTAAMFKELPATGAGGGAALKTFLELSPFDGDTGKGPIEERAD